MKRARAQSGGSMDHVIGVDIGTQSTKALLVRLDGTIVAQHAKAYAPDTPRPELGRAMAAGLARRRRRLHRRLRPQGRRELNSGAPLAPEHIKAVCVSSLYGGSGIPVDADMKPLHPCLIWMDRRAEAQVDWVRSARRPRAPARHHRQRRRQLLRLHQDAVAARQPARRLGEDAAISCRRTPSWPMR